MVYQDPLLLNELINKKTKLKQPSASGVSTKSIINPWGTSSSYSTPSPIKTVNFDIQPLGNVKNTTSSPTVPKTIGDTASPLGGINDMIKGNNTTNNSNVIQNIQKQINDNASPTQGYITSSPYGEGLSYNQSQINELKKRYNYFGGTPEQFVSGADALNSLPFDSSTALKILKGNYNAESGSSNFIGDFQNFQKQLGISQDTFDYASEQQKAQEAENIRLDAIRAAITAAAKRERDTAKDIATKRESGRKALLGISEGLNATSFGADYVEQVDKDLQDELSRIDQEESKALAEAEYTSADKLSATLTALRNERNTVNQKIIDNFNSYQEFEKSGKPSDYTDYTFYKSETEKTGKAPLSYLEWKIEVNKKSSDNTKEVGGVLYEKQDDGTWKQMTTKSDYSGTVGEYEYYKKQEESAGRTPMTFNEYQTADANRKARASGSSSTTKKEAEQKEVNDTINAIGQNLLNNYRGSDGYIDTAKYKQAYQEFASKYPSYAKNFTDYFPPNLYLNPEDETAANLLG